MPAGAPATRSGAGSLSVRWPMSLGTGQARAMLWLPGGTGFSPAAPILRSGWEAERPAKVPLLPSTLVTSRAACLVPN